MLSVAVPSTTRPIPPRTGTVSLTATATSGDSVLSMELLLTNPSAIRSVVSANPSIRIVRMNAFTTLYEESLESYCPLDKELDILWSCVTCLLYQISLKAQHLQHGDIRQLEYYTRQKFLSFARSPVQSCQYIGLFLTDSLDELFALPSSACLDHLRLKVSFQLVLHALSALTTHASFVMDGTMMNYPTPFASLRYPLNYHECLLEYLKILESRLEIQSICGYVQALNEQERLELLLRLIQVLYSALQQPPYQTLLQESISDKTRQNFIILKLEAVMNTLKDQTNQFVSEFLHRNVLFVNGLQRTCKEEFVSVCRFLCYELTFVDREWKERLVTALISLFNECAVEHSALYIPVLKFMIVNA